MASSGRRERFDWSSLHALVVWGCVLAMAWSVWRPESAQAELVEGERAALVRAFPGIVRVSRTDRFEVLTDSVDGGWGESLAASLEEEASRYFEAMRALGVAAEAPDASLRCLAFSTREAFIAFAREHDGIDASWMGGYCAPGSGRIVIYDDRSGPGFAEAMADADAMLREARAHRQAGRSRSDAEREALIARAMSLELEAARLRLRTEAEAWQATKRKLAHESAHLLALATGVQRPGAPSWVAEGFAESMASGALREIAMGGERPAAGLAAPAAAADGPALGVGDGTLAAAGHDGHRTAFYEAARARVDAMVAEDPAKLLRLLRGELVLGAGSGG